MCQVKCEAMIGLIALVLKLRCVARLKCRASNRRQTKSKALQCACTTKFILGSPMGGHEVVVLVPG